MSLFKILKSMFKESFEPVQYLNHNGDAGHYPSSVSRNLSDPFLPLNPLILLHIGMLKKSASGVLGLLSCSRIHLYAPPAQSPAVLPEEKHVLACTGWAGETIGPF